MATNIPSFRDADLERGLKEYAIKVIRETEAPYLGAIMARNVHRTFSKEFYYFQMADDGDLKPLLVMDWMVTSNSDTTDARLVFDDGTAMNFESIRNQQRDSLNSILPSVEREKQMNERFGFFDQRDGQRSKATWAALQHKAQEKLRLEEELLEVAVQQQASHYISDFA